MSGHGLGAVLQQRHANGDVHPISYASRLLTSAETRYITQEQECLAVVFGILKFEVYLRGRHFTVVTDHQAILNVRTCSSPSSRVLRWSFFLNEFNFSVRHIPGKVNLMPDALSRLPQLSTENVIAFISLNDNATNSRQKWLAAQQKDDFCIYCVRGLKNATLDKATFVLDDDQLLMHRELETDRLQVVVPFAFIQTVLSQCHSVPTAGHFGMKRTCALIQTSFFWPSWRSDVVRFIRQCQQCQQYRGSRYLGVELSETAITAEYFLDKVSIDIQGPFRLTERNNQYILNMQDIFTKLVLSIPLPDTKTQTVASAYMNCWVPTNGPARQLLSDNGTNFKSKQLADLNRLLQTHADACAIHNAVSSSGKPSGALWGYSKCNGC